jgi:hypothetical protein
MPDECGVGPVTRQVFRDQFADSLGRPGDDGHLVGQRLRFAHVVLLCRCESIELVESDIGGTVSPSEPASEVTHRPLVVVFGERLKDGESALDHPQGGFVGGSGPSR